MTKTLSTEYRPSIVIQCDNDTLEKMCAFILERESVRLHPDLHMAISLLMCALELNSRNKGA